MQISRDALLKPLQIVSGIVERRHTLPILANILIRKKEEQLTLVSTDIDIQISTTMQVEASLDDIETTLSARKLLDILKALPENGSIKLSLTDKKMSINAGQSKFKLQTLAAEDFPLVAQPESYAVSVELPQKTLKQLFQMVHFSMAQQDIRYYLNGLLLVTEEHTVKAVATDGHRLAFFSANVPHALTKQEAIIPRKTILELQRLLGDVDDPVKIDIAANQARFSFSGIELISKLIEGKFPDFNRVIPSFYTKHFAISRQALLSAFQRVSILTSEKFRGVRLVFEDNLLRISSTNADQEDALEELNIHYPYEQVEIGFNVGYLIDVLSNLKEENIQLSIGDSNTSVLITLPNSDAFKYVVMPMRI